MVAAAIADGATGQPSYLGTVIHDVPGAGTRTNPDFAAIAAAKPDLILGSAALTPEAYPKLSALAPTVFTEAPGAGGRTTCAPSARPPAGRRRPAN